MDKNIAAIPALMLMMALTGCDVNTTTSTSAENSAQSTTAPTEIPTIQPPPLIERSVLFGNPTRYQGRLSPDGTQMSFRAPWDGVMNLWVGERGDYTSVKAITNDKGRGIPSHFWALDSQHVLYIQDQGGDENWHLYSVDLTNGVVQHSFCNLA